jgi:hypothetical protein
MDSHAADRRRGPRYPPREGTTVTCREAGAGPEDLALRALNVSELGVGLCLRQPLGRGQMVEVGLSAPGWPRPLIRVGTVVWSRLVPGGDCLVGVVFASGLEPAQLQDLCRPLEV